MSHSRIAAATLAWVQQVVVGHNFCPFAKAVLDADRIHVAVIASSRFETCLEKLVLELERLDADPAIETTLVVFPEAVRTFDRFLDFIDLAEQLMRTLGYEGIYQLAHFHPDYQFEGLQQNDAANYTNRSPYPTLHLIREASLEKALEHFPNPENIPERNIDYARKLGEETLARQLAACKQV